MVLISDQSYNDNPENFISKFSSVILIHSLHYKTKLINSGFEILSEENGITVLNKK